MDRKEVPTSVLKFPTEQPQVASASERAYNALFSRTYEKSRRYAAIELNDDDAAEDLAQGVLVAVWHHYFRDRESVDEALDALVYRMIRLRLKNHKRNRLRHLKLLGTHLGLWAGRAKRWMLPAEYVEHDELVAVLDGALSKMTPRCREVFLMHREGGMTLKEIAALSGVTESTVNNLMHRAHLVLRKDVDRAGFGTEARRRLADKVGRKA